MIDFIREAGTAFLWVLLGYLMGERQSKKLASETAQKVT